MPDDDGMFLRAASVIALAVGLAASAANAGGATPARTRVVQYWFKAEFGIGIDVVWSRDFGNHDEPCSQWSHEEGTYEVSVASVGETPPGKKAGSFIHPIQGLQSLDKDPAWAILYAGGGHAKVHMKRTLRQEGQTNACGTQPAVKTKFPPNDCGERNYVSRNVFVRQDFRDSFLTLEDILTAPRKLRRRAISIDAQAQQILYQRCDVPVASLPVGVQNVAVPVSPNDLSKLRGMKLGETMRLEHRPSGGSIGGVVGGCLRHPLADGESCQAGVDIHLAIKRVKPPSGR